MLGWQGGWVNQGRLLLWTVACLLLVITAHAQSTERVGIVLKPPADISELIGKPLQRIEIVTRGDRWAPKVQLKRVHPGQSFHPQLARQAMQELAATGQFADLQSELELESQGVVLRLIVLPRRIVTQIKIMGGTLSEEATLKSAGLAREQAITVFDADRISHKVQEHYHKRGYAEVKAQLQIVDTDSPMRVVALIRIDTGPRQRVSKVSLVVDPKTIASVRELAKEYQIEVGDPVDEDAFAVADASLKVRLDTLGWHMAEVKHRSLADGVVELSVQPGSQVRMRFEGNRNFNSEELMTALDLEATQDRSETTLLNRLRDFYQARGYLDAQVAVRYQGAVTAPIIDQVFVIRELQPVRVVGRQYPCLSGPRSAADVDREIDGVLSGTLPSIGLLGPPNAAGLSGNAAEQQSAQNRVVVQEQEPWATYKQDVYERAVKHIQELYRSEGYLSATVGPAVLLRRQCDPRSGAKACRPMGERAHATPKTCSEQKNQGERIPEGLRCTYDAKRGQTCESDVVVEIPINLGPQTMLYDLKFDGNRNIVEDQLKELSGLTLGQPTSYLELAKAQQRIVDAYANEGFAFASVEGDFQLSADRTRARAQFVISERDQVKVKEIVVQGAVLTREDVILSRTTFASGDIFKRSEARRTEELLATLGVFASATVALRDPEVPAREKTIVITVRERAPQYLEVRPGVSSGEGVRLTMEYGHRNLGGEAIAFRLRLQLGYLPDAFIFDEDVQRNYSELPVSRRMERHNSVAVEFPSFGLGPLFRLILEGVDVRDNSRDYGITKDAAVVTVNYRPNVKLTAGVRGSFEFNNAEVFGDDAQDALEDYLRENNSSSLQRMLNVPQGHTFAVAQRAAVLWDERDNPFGATRGTLFSASAEHVSAYPLEEGLELTSHFMHYAARASGYLRITDAGMALAASFGAGFNHQLKDQSQTYPDRYFFLGGADSVRGFLQASIVPEDIAQNILDPNNPLTINEVTIRGGDVYINPRVELRVPITSIWQTAVFMDAGNLWLDARTFDPTVLRYATGTGLRANTPIGPLALDYGINLNRRPWEDFGAFHFSIGLF